MAVAGPGSAHAQGSTFLYFDSKAGDFIGQGRQFTLTPADGAITLPTIAGAAVWIQFNNSVPTQWNLMFAPPAGVPLVPGIYERSTRYPFQSPTTPGLNVSGDGRECNKYTSRFVVYENDLSGPSPRFAADYEQHCDGKAPALFGAVRYNSSVPLGARLSVSNAAVYEGDGEPRALPFVISLSAPAAVPVSVAYATLDGTASAGSDYAPVSGTATFAVGQTAVNVDVPVLGDTVAEGDETIVLALSNAQGAPILNGQGTGTIRNDDPDRTLIRFDSPVGDWVGLGQHFTLTPLDGTITPQPTPEGGVYVAFTGATFWDLRFVPPAGTPLVPGVYEGAARWPFQSPTTPGMDVQGDGRGCNAIVGRFVILELQYDLNGGVARLAVDYEQHCDGGPPLFGSVRYNSSIALAPRLSVSSAAVYEGDGEPRSLTFTVSLSAPSSSAVTVDFGTVDGTATAGSDYSPISGTISLAPGQTAARVDVPVLGDLVPEGDETVDLVLGNASGAAISFTKAEGTIVNDDPNTTALGFHSEANDWVGSGDTFTLSPLEGTITAEKVGEGVHVHFQGSRTWDLYFAPPQGKVLTPGVYEGATRWTFQSPLTPGLEVVGNGHGCGTITGRFVLFDLQFGLAGQVQTLALDYEQHCEGGPAALFGSVRFNSPDRPRPRFSVSPAVAYEGDGEPETLAFFVTLTAPAAAPVSVEYSTVDGTAVAGLDFAEVHGTASFAVGQSVVRVEVPILGNLIPEPDKSFTLSLHDPIGASIAFGQGQGTILDDDPYRSSIQFSGDRDDYIGAGRRFTVTPLDGLTTVTRNADNGVHVSFQGSITWELDFAAPDQMPLVPGAYLDAVRFPSSPGLPGLGVSGDLRSCDSLTGRFVVLEAEYDLNGKVLHFAADFEQHCYGSAPALFGSVRFNARAPVAPKPAVAAGFHTVTPCRLIDTREIEAPVYCGGTGATRSFSATGHCGVPLSAKAVALNLTAIQSTESGDLRFFAAATVPPLASALNFSRGQVRASNAIVPLGTIGAVQMLCDLGGAVDVLADVVGYFE